MVCLFLNKVQCLITCLEMTLEKYHLLAVMNKRDISWCTLLRIVLLSSPSSSSLVLPLSYRFFTTFLLRLRVTLKPSASVCKSLSCSACFSLSRALRMSSKNVLKNINSKQEHTFLGLIPL